VYTAAAVGEITREPLGATVVEMGPPISTTVLALAVVQERVTGVLAGTDVALAVNDRICTWPEVTVTVTVTCTCPAALLAVSV
jgi:hypothetical protein